MCIRDRNYATLILKGGYWEHTPEGKFWRGPGHFRYRKSDDLHRLELAKDENGNVFTQFTQSPVLRKILETGKEYGVLFWDEIAAEGPVQAKVVDIFRKYNADMQKAGRPYRYG